MILKYRWAHAFKIWTAAPDGIGKRGIVYEEEKKVSQKQTRSSLYNGHHRSNTGDRCLTRLCILKTKDYELTAFWDAQSGPLDLVESEKGGEVSCDQA